MTINMEIKETIAAPPERVFATLTDLDGASAWMRGLVEIEKLTQGPFGAGTRWREVRRFMGQKASEIFEVIDVEPARRVELFCDGKNGTSKSGHYRFTYTLVPKDAETELTLALELSQLTWLGEQLGRLFAGLYRSMIAKEVRAMKSYIESARATEAVAPPPAA
jgi:uncharacterized protein YndB with AHSA1/START domain